MNQAYKLLLGVLEEKMGFIVLGSEQDDFAITDYIPDSLTFIQFIVALEESLEVELPDEFLNNELLVSAKGFASKLDEFLSQSYSNKL